MDFNNSTFKYYLKDFVNKLSLTFSAVGSSTRASAEFCEGVILDACSDWGMTGWREVLRKATWES